MPRRANTNPKRAFSDANRMSIGNVIVTPTPTAGPFTAAITGFFDSKIRSDTSPPASRGMRSGPSWAPPPAGSEGLAAPGQVGPGAEAASGTGDDHYAHAVVGVGAVEGVDDLAPHRSGEGVEPVGPIEGQSGDAILDVVADLRVVHGR